MADEGLFAAHQAPVERAVAVDHRRSRRIRPRLARGWPRRCACAAPDRAPAPRSPRPARPRRRARTGTARCRSATIAATSPTRGAATASPAAIASTTEIGNCSDCRRQREQIEQPDRLGRLGDEAGQMDAVLDAAAHAASARIASRSGPSPAITSCHSSGRPAKARTSRGRFLTLRSPASVPTHISPFCLTTRGSASRLGALAIGGGVDAVGDQAHRGCAAGARSSSAIALERARRHHQRRARAQRDAAIPVAAALEPGGLVLVEAVLVVDQRRRACRRRRTACAPCTASIAPQL